MRAREEQEKNEKGIRDYETFLSTKKLKNPYKYVLHSFVSPQWAGNKAEPWNNNILFIWHIFPNSISSSWADILQAVL